MKPVNTNQIRLLLIYFFSLLLITGCNANRQQSHEQRFFTIDFSKSYPEKKIYLQDIADIKYVPLETNNDVLLDRGARIAFISDDCYVIYNGGRGDVFVFNADGKIRYHFNKKGKGPEEYMGIQRLIVDEKNQEIFVAFYSDPQKIIVYAFDGAYKRTLYTPENCYFVDVYNFDDQTLFAYDTKNINMPNAKEIANRQPYYILSKENGKEVSRLDLKFKERVTNVIIIQSDNMMQSRTLYTENNLKFGQKFLITDMSSDTIYHLKQDGNLVPLMAKKPSVFDTNPPVIIATGLETDKFLSVTNFVLDFKSDQNSVNNLITELMYDYGTGEVYKPLIYNADLPERNFNIAIDKMELPRNMTAQFYRVDRLVEALEQGNLKGELKEITSKLKEEDNPVLVIVNFK